MTMNANYHQKQVEKTWQKYWRDNASFVANALSNRPKYYMLEMLPYPFWQATYGACAQLYHR